MKRLRSPANTEEQAEKILKALEALPEGQLTKGIKEKLRQRLQAFREALGEYELLKDATDTAQDSHELTRFQLWETIKEARHSAATTYGTQSRKYQPFSAGRSRKA